jgi:predicted ATP-dependent Lon-type protease
LEYLLGKYCASSDEMAIQMGLQVVNDTLADNYIHPDASTKAQSKVKENGRHTFIDKVKVRLVDSQYWAEVTNFGHKFVHIPDHYVRDFDRLHFYLPGWGVPKMRNEHFTDHYASSSTTWPRPCGSCGNTTSPRSSTTTSPWAPI